MSEDLFQCIMAFFEDNILTDCGIHHHESPFDADEDMTPPLENTVGLLWLQMLHPGPHELVKKRYKSELRNN